MIIKKLSVIALTSLSLISLSACRQQNQALGQNGSAQNHRKASVSEDKAKELAFKDASITAADAQRLKLTKETDDGRVVYDIEFDAKDQEYSYTIDANTGEILEKSSEPITEAPASAQAAGGQADKAAGISEDKAKELAFKDASITAADAQRLKLTKETDDGRVVYDIEFDAKDQEYSYTIDANSGDILEKSSEPVYD
ncbi:PepSY domain-containing protein [Streptococcus equi subsp. zooepidemicus]|uniref:Putative lipoprotein n=1 Tax=Streptococcus equi subsp. zooepidemicus (strain H70) TaxID=553483 RepID=C0MGU6_STRS7|nr:PepSY domain-containing protein [Streptococcus equi]MCD3395799.1 PepSY domain-containing protein [Streptococcus equi subsp. zooepidemicus]MCD3399542.1 PepSY domain-containing protein [Streptococcus equi subsp. zooepidemicus]MCD3449523.1 PepSY domain-containing protein [Streptococcus equi subsp. zooepidemicus]MCD3451365.1 PepSY domain-containing protein [Streptococcus equi subsp. zooepidemicus]MCD3465337.1 PepSY domain-containing protein [Streptococcus equi subsp. zooepidemicus]